MKVGIKINNAPTSTIPYKTILPTRLWGISNGASANGTAGRVYLQRVEVPEQRIINGISFVNWNPTNGNVYVGIYPDIGTGTPVGATLLVSSASTAVSGTVDTGQTVSIADTTLTAGSYYVAIQFSGTTNELLFHNNKAVYIDLTTGFYYDRAGGYGAFTTPCPASTSTYQVPLAIINIKP